MDRIPFDYIFVPSSNALMSLSLVANSIIVYSMLTKRGAKSKPDFWFLSLATIDIGMVLSAIGFFYVYVSRTIVSRDIDEVTFN